MVAKLAPPSPPCFGVHDKVAGSPAVSACWVWREFLASAVEVQSSRAGSARGPMLLSPEGRMRNDKLDPDWSFCGDCAYTPDERAAMRAKGTCQPEWWRQNVPPLAEGELAPKTARRTQGGTRQRRVIPVQLQPA